MFVAEIWEQVEVLAFPQLVLTYLKLLSELPLTPCTRSYNVPETLAISCQPFQSKMFAVQLTRVVVPGLRLTGDGLTVTESIRGSVFQTYTLASIVSLVSLTPNTGTVIKVRLL